jgi:amino acid permease
MVAKKKERESNKERHAIISTTFNFTNSIIGAGAMGLGGAFAASGGGISIIILVGCAYLTKRSLDLIVDLSSCPLVINLARRSKEDRDRDRNGEESDSDDKDVMSDYPPIDAPTISDFLKQDSEYLQTRRVTEDVDLDTHQEVEVAGDEEKKESSHLITQEEEINVIDVENDSSHPQTDTTDLINDLDSTRFDNDHDVDSNMQTPLKISDLFADHPFPTPNESDLLMKDEEMDPRFISPLHIDEAISSAPTIPIVDEEHLLQPCTYEELGYAAFGSNGRLAVLVSKSLYSFGCLIAYIVVVRDNFGLALRRIIIGPTTIGATGWIYDDNFLAFWISAIFMLPLSCPRTMESLTKFSFLSILSIIFLTFAIVYMYFSCTNPRGSGDLSSFYENWLVIRSFSGLIESLGCFVFTFVCHHTVHLAYESLPLQSRSPKTWRRVSTISIAMALETSLAIGIFAYLTFGSTTPSDVLTGYPVDITLANVARLLLCMNMVLTFPLPFLTCRELIILLLTDMHGFYHRHDLERFNICITMWKHIHYVYITILCRSKPRQRAARDAYAAENENFVQMKQRSFFERWTRNSSYGDGLGASGEWLYDMHGDGEGPTEALLREESESDDDAIGSIGGERGMPLNPSPLSSRSGDPSSEESTVSCTFVPTPSWILPDCNGRQLTFFWHAILTFILWLIVTISAIKSPSLIDVLDLVGAFTGTMIAFILPAVFSLKLKGYSRISFIILGIGGTIGLLGTNFSLVKFVRDSI